MQLMNSGYCLDNANFVVYRYNDYLDANRLKSTLGLLTDLYKSVLGLLTDLYKSALGLLTDLYKPALGLLTNLYKSALGLFTDPYKSALGLLTKLYNSALGLLTGHHETALGLLTGHHESALGLLTGHHESVLGLLSATPMLLPQLCSSTRDQLLQCLWVSSSRRAGGEDATKESFFWSTMEAATPAMKVNDGQDDPGTASLTVEVKPCDAIVVEEAGVECQNIHCDEESLKRLHNNINKFHPTIRLTIDYSLESVSFLDTRISIKDGHLSTS
eukprot:g42388.t1